MLMLDETASIKTLPKNVISLSEYPVLCFLIVAKSKNKIIYSNWMYASTLCFLSVIVLYL